MTAMNRSASARRIWLLALVLPILSGCMSMYVDGNTKEVAPAQYHKPAALHPVQFFYEFQTKGVANAAVTGHTKERVLTQVKDSGLFSSVSDEPVASGANLSITVNNVPLTDDAFSKGFVTGLTFGLAGSQVSDGYVCTARYRANAQTPAEVKQVRHAIHTTIGSGGPPANAVKANSAEDAVTLMLRQIVSNALNDISRDPQFK
jgi:hypothetical protein